MGKQLQKRYCELQKLPLHRMPTFTYKARTNTGTLIRGTMEGSSKDAVFRSLKSSGYVPVKISVSSNKFFPFFSPVRTARISSIKLGQFTRQLASLQRVGISILESLQTLQEQYAFEEVLCPLLEHVMQELQAGKSLSESLALFPDVFNQTYVNMVTVGETSGNLVEVLERLADLLEFEDDIRSRIRSATLYPVIVIAALILAFIMLFTFVIPKFIAMYSQLHVPLPVPTRVLIGVYSLLSRYGIFVLFIAVGLGIVIYRYINTRKGRWIFDKFKLKIWVFGHLYMLITMARFTRVMAILLKSGVPIIEVLRLADDIMANTYLSSHIELLRQNVLSGKGLAFGMRSAEVFPPVVIQMVAAGEESGDLEELLSYVSQYYEKQSDYLIKNLSILIEPFLVVVLAVGILIMALGVFLPLWNFWGFYVN